VLPAFSAEVATIERSVRAPKVSPKRMPTRISSLSLRESRMPKTVSATKAMRVSSSSVSSLRLESTRS
jgi:hypothetical protein